MSADPRYETRAVLAAAYVDLDGRCLTHSVVVDEKGQEQKVLCRKVRIESIADVGAMDPETRPTCSTCARIDPRWRTASFTIPIYDVRLVRARKPLQLAEPSAPDASKAALVLHGLIGLTDREHLAVIFLDGRHNITGVHVAAVGGQSGIASVDCRTILRAALLACAAGIIVGHNHPSGDPTPSREDRAFTDHLDEACKVVGIPLVDHVIVTKEPGVYRAGWGVL